MFKPKKDESKKEVKVKSKKVKIVKVTEIDFGDVTVKETSFSDGSSKVEKL